MKTRYLMIIIVLILVAVGFELLVCFSQLGEYPHLENAVRSAGIFVALTAAVVALSAADPKEKLVKAKIEPSVDKGTGWYSKKQLSAKLKDSYQNFPDPIKSNKVHFKIPNISGSSLRKPTLTFRLPLEKAHPLMDTIMFTMDALSIPIFIMLTVSFNCWSSQTPGYSPLAICRIGMMKIV